MAGAYSRPERSAEFAIAHRIRAQISRDPCSHCTHRDVAFGIASCPTYGRAFPRCLSTPGLQFEIDHSTLRKAP